MSKIRIICLVLCFTLFLASSAMFISSARGNVDVTKQASLTLGYGYGELEFKDLEVRIYKVANMIGNTTFIQDGDFAEVPVELNKIKSQSEWKEVASTLYGYVVSKKISATASVKTDENGEASFSQLETGLYFVEGVRLELEEGIYSFDGFMITLPGVDVNEEWIYDVVAKPKSSFEEYEEKEVEYKINKLWKDDGNKDKRPSEIEIDLYKDGTLENTVTLSSLNDWSFSWKSEEGHNWTAVEKDVEEGYTVTLTQNGNSFIMVNTYDDDPPPPQTGDSSGIFLTVALLSIGGALFLLVGFVKSKGKADEAY